MAHDHHVTQGTNPVPREDRSADWYARQLAVLTRQLAVLRWQREHLKALRTAVSGIGAEVGTKIHLAICELDAAEKALVLEAYAKHREIPLVGEA